MGVARPRSIVLVRTPIAACSSNVNVFAPVYPTLPTCLNLLHTSVNPEPLSRSWNEVDAMALVDKGHILWGQLDGQEMNFAIGLELTPGESPLPIRETESPG